ncbi:pyridoxamine 5'-phosphate oxidase family protein [Micromonospora sp. WMMD1082]|uniref:pyridoxamine 5'-phosphate oxidase family protein n=1 Tax=Micromonospora sp. WMMD1082 TaxID=3016104 RepID=UPI002416647A|nr:pyridoxamine 5'-phosphate oxidase family protein [Micromonospora sp. WMMD1082]MDG4795705.1 pyridoxamine 5'-phosphate oxidase family protein [Micromonospora sp. WMMD1082]
MPVIEPALLDTLDRYLTCEFATLSRDGTPIAWPTTPLPCGDGTFLITTSVAFPQKAFNVRRDGRVALLFSNPTGTGLANPPQVMIGGEATCPDVINVVPEGDLGRFWRRIFERQPSSHKFLQPLTRNLMDWYFMRLLIRITPRLVESNVLPASAASQPADGVPGSKTVARYPSAVLGARDKNGNPILRRVTVDALDGRYQIHLPHDADMTSGPASLLVHRHDEHLADMHNASVAGILEGSAASGWSLLPRRIIEPVGDDSLLGRIRSARRCRATADQYLTRRGLARPSIPWADYRALLP